MRSKIKVVRSPKVPSSAPLFGMWVMYCPACGVAIPSFLWQEAMLRVDHHIDIHRKHDQWEESRCA